MEQTGVILQVVGWALWAIMVRTVRLTTAPRWIVADYYASTALLCAATFCTGAGIVIGNAAALRWLAIVVGIAALVAVVALALGSASSKRGALAAETQAADVSGYTVRTAPRPARQPLRGSYASASARVQAIEAMEVAI